MSRSWVNWAGNVRSTARRVARPSSVGEVVQEVKSAVRDGLTVKAVGSGHSFTPIAATDGVRLELSRLNGLRDFGPDSVTVDAGMPVSRLNELLQAHGRSLTNMGDVAVQTVSGAVATGTHGTGRSSAGLAQQLRALEIVLADGSVVTCSDVHAYPGTDWQGYFAAAEHLFVSRDGRPHWGKLHTRDVSYLSGRYPRFADALAVRGRVDPHRVFTNPYLERVLGP